MTRQPISVRRLPPRYPPITSKIQMSDIPPVSELPTRDLPPTARLDYRRLCEVEHNVRSKNIGLVDEQNTKLLADSTAPLFPSSCEWSGQKLALEESMCIGGGDAMDLD